MIIRSNYLEKLKPFIDVKLVKILPGIRRCGKSTILEMLKQELLSRGIDEKHIITRKYSNEDYDISFTSNNELSVINPYSLYDILIPVSFSIASNCSTISPEVKFLEKGIPVEAQNLHPILHPI